MEAVGCTFQQADERRSKIISFQDYQPEVYDSWASHYDQDMAVLGYSLVDEAVARVEKLNIINNQDVRILDVCCATGLLGKELKDKGYSQLYGFDGSQEFLKKAKEKGAYLHLDQVLLNAAATLPYNKNFFDFTVCLGVFKPGRVCEVVLPELIRVTKPGGYIISMGRHEHSRTVTRDYDLKGALERYVVEGVWERLPDENALYYTRGPIGATVHTLRIC